MTVAHRPAGRLEVLDELKGVAILLVVLYHAGGVLAWADTFHGEVGVDMFVILSGIGLTLGRSSTSGAGEYLLRRLMRIYPAYWTALTSFILLSWVVLHEPAGTTDIVLHYLGVHGWCGDAHAMSINDSFWFITLIVTLYVVYLPLRRFADRPDRLFLAGAVISVATSIVCLKANQPVAFGTLSLRIPGFFIGLVVGRWLRLGKIDIGSPGPWGIAAFLLFYVPYFEGFIYSSVWVGGALLLLYAFAIRPVAAPRMRRDMKFLGDRSLEIFLIHQPLIRSYNYYVLYRLDPGVQPPPWMVITGMVVWFGIAVALADGLHRLLARLPDGRGRAPGAAPA